MYKLRLIIPWRRDALDKWWTAELQKCNRSLSMLSNSSCCSKRIHRDWTYRIFEPSVAWISYDLHVRFWHFHCIFAKMLESILPMVRVCFAASEIWLLTQKPAHAFLAPLTATASSLPCCLGAPAIGRGILCLAHKPPRLDGTRHGDHSCNVGSR